MNIRGGVKFTRRDFTELAAAIRQRHPANRQHRTLISEKIPRVLGFVFKCLEKFRKTGDSCIISLKRSSKSRVRGIFSRKAPRNCGFKVFFLKNNFKTHRLRLFSWKRKTSVDFCEILPGKQQ